MSLMKAEKKNNWANVKDKMMMKRMRARRNRKKSEFFP